MSRITVQRQNWQRWPRVLIAERRNDDGTVDERRYVPEGGKLTAEQVREAIFSGSSYASYDGAKYYADGIGMQAIADELNAALGWTRDRAMERGCE